MKSVVRIIFLLLIVIFSAPDDSYSQSFFPVKYSKNKRFLVDAKNKPFPILGRTAWFVISQSEEGYKKFISNSLSHGYNSIEMSVITHWPMPMGNHAPFNGRGDMPFLKRLNGTEWDGKLTYTDIQKEAPDLTTPNERYWKYVDEFLSYCDANRVLVFLFPAYLGYEGGEQGWMQELLANDTAKTEAYGAWIGNRFKNRKNIVWMLLGDMGKFTNEQVNVETALVKGLKSVKGQSVHYSAESHSGENSADQVNFGNEMTLNGTYTWSQKVSVPSLGRKAYMHNPVMPSFLLEEPYDEEGPDGNAYNPNATQPVRRFQWWGWLSTIGGYISGNAYVWQFVDPGWVKHLNTQGTLDMGRLNSFIKSITWWKLVPSGLNGMKTLITEGNAVDTSESYVAAAATTDGKLLVAYIPPAHVGNITVDLSVLKNNMYANWFDPTNGRYKNISNFPFSNSGTQSFTPPGKNGAGQNDWVLVFTEKNYAVTEQ